MAISFYYLTYTEDDCLFSHCAFALLLIIEPFFSKNAPHGVKSPYICGR